MNRRPIPLRHLLLRSTLVLAALPAGCGVQLPAMKSATSAERDPGDVLLSYTDDTRGRAIPIRVSRPADDNAPWPLILFSPGIGNTRDNYVSLGRAWTAAGFAVVFLTHPGADHSEMYGDHPTPASVIRTIQSYIQPLEVRWEHPQDVSFVIDSLMRDPQFSGQFDFKHIGVAGHSFGAYTALVLVGLHPDGGRDVTDRRIRAALAFSPPGLGVLGISPESVTGIEAPSMITYGTLDLDPSTLDVGSRRQIYDLSEGPDQFLLKYINGTHGLCDSEGVWFFDWITYEAFRTTTETATTWFFKTYLGHDATARAALLAAELPTEEGWNAWLEYKNITPEQAEGQ